MLRARELEHEFETAFWPLYPHKIGKAAALRAYIKARQSVTHSVTFVTLRDGVERYVRDKPRDVSWCNPATWLNGQRWLDEPGLAPVAGKSNGTSGFLRNAALMAENERLQRENGECIDHASTDQAVLSFPAKR
jgi:hypothetical protein